MLLAHELAPVQRLAVQAAFLRSTPTLASGRLVASQYALWAAEGWAVVGAEDEDEGGVEMHVSDMPPMPTPPPTQPTHPRSPRSPRRPVGAENGRPAYVPRKAYTSSTLMQQRRSGSSGAPVAVSPPKSSSPPENMFSPGDVTGHLGLLTAQIGSLAAQCTERLASRSENSRELQAVAAALHTVSRVWQDEVSRAPGSTFVRPQAMCDTDLRVVLRDLDRLLQALENRPDHA
ncbi:hypothetical protein LPJ73_006180 [Coemansia sp. RSA 2703]|nr:hypothetical protein LPJ73_006180 [Coemansia sp. RSA 2703]